MSAIFTYRSGRGFIWSELEKTILAVSSKALNTIQVHYGKCRIQGFVHLWIILVFVSHPERTCESHLYLLLLEKLSQSEFSRREDEWGTRQKSDHENGDKRRWDGRSRQVVRLNKNLMSSCLFVWFLHSQTCVLKNVTSALWAAGLQFTGSSDSF